MPRIPRPGRRSSEEEVNPPAEATAGGPDTTAAPNGELPPGAPAPATAGNQEEEKPAAGAPSPAPEPPTAVIPAAGTAGAPAGDGAGVPAGQEPEPPGTGFGHRGQLRRRLRFLRRARELGLRDLGGLVFDMHRFGRRRDDLVAGKIATLTRIDGEMRELEIALDDVQPVTVLHEPGITACPVCSAINGTEANFCSNCGLPLGRKSSEPVTAPQVASGEAPPAASPSSALGAQAAAAGGQPPAAAPSPFAPTEAPTASFAATPPVSAGAAGAARAGRGAEGAAAAGEADESAGEKAAPASEPPAS